LIFHKPHFNFLKDAWSLVRMPQASTQDPALELMQLKRGAVNEIFSIGSDTRALSGRTLGNSANSAADQRRAHYTYKQRAVGTPPYFRQ
jgi:hypothetical protein